MIYNQLSAALESVPLRDFYYSKDYRLKLIEENTAWFNKTTDTNMSTGYIGDILDEEPYELGTYTSNSTFKHITVGALLKFSAPAGYLFDKENNNELIKIIPNSPAKINTTDIIWTKVISIYGDGTNNRTGVTPDGITGTVVLNDNIPNAIVDSNTKILPILSQIIPAWRSALDINTISTMIDLIYDNKPFGLRYDIDSKAWRIIFESNLNITDSFNLTRQGDVSNNKLDSSWLILFTTDTEFYTVTSRLIRYIFESDKQIRFYFDSSDKIYDTRTNSVVKDKIKILNINTAPGQTFQLTFDRDWEISEEFKGLDGYVDTKKIQVTFADSDDDGVVDNPDIFEEIVDSSQKDYKKYVVLERYEVSLGQEDYRWFNNSDDTVVLFDTEDLRVLNYNDGQYFYFIDSGLLHAINGDFSDNIGALFENMVFWQLYRVYGNIYSETIFYYKDLNNECDFIVARQEGIPLPVQVTTSLKDESVRNREIKGLLKACRFCEVKKGFIITLEEEETYQVSGIEIEILPAWKWCSENRML